MYTSEDEQLESIRKWWEENGKSVVFGVVIGLGAVFGWRYWEHHQATQAEAASNLYQEIMTALNSESPREAADPANEIINDYGGTGYAPLARLVLARLAVERDDLEAAADHLNTALAEAGEVPLQLALRLRLGQVLLARGDLDGAMAIIDVEDSGAYQASYAELRGDILVQQGEQGAALEAYQAALEHGRAQSEDTSILEMKINDLGASTRG